MKYNEDKDFKFLDIGGENIDFYLILRKKFKNIKYYVYNLKTVLNVLEKIKKKYALNNFFIVNNFSDLDKIEIDFTNFGSSIQYINNYENFLTLAMKISKYIFFSGTSFFQSKNIHFTKSIVVKQVNVLPDINYLYFFNKEYFYNILLKNDYKIVFETLNKTDKINYKNFSALLKKVEYKDVLFSNNKA